MEAFIAGSEERNLRDFPLRPAIESQGVRAINSDIPGVLREHVLWVPRAYLKDRHHSAA